MQNLKHPRRNTGARLFFTTLFLSTIVVPNGARAQESILKLVTDQQLIRAGRDAYLRHCMGCHGVNADGNGAGAEMLDPKPRNLVSGAFKFRSTPLGTLPTLQDLVRTINYGIPNSAMPNFRLLPENQKLALALYIQSLRPDWKKNEGRPVNLPPVPEKLFDSKINHLEAALRGKKLFEEACLTCHGEKGLGDGPGSVGLTDADNQPIKPANLSLRTVKSGATARDLYRDIWTGLDGTPMPAFEGVYSEVQVWDIVAFVFYLRGNKANFYDFENLNDSVVASLKTKAKAESTTGSGGGGQ